MIEEIKLEILYEAKNRREAELIYNSLLPEFKKGFPGLSSFEISLSENKLSIVLIGRTIARIRAIFNAIMRWLISIENLNDIIGV
ncbi:MAG: KEOPS complex subunit Pcc1 [Thermoproteota archaeon]|jgi:tRNA threonylcarbamoyladenosine modification (KEOPS) complex  Pcc1 subunit|nr:KEOPS complex subunit Pcc1 [Thermoproteota archaeon]